MTYHEARVHAYRLVTDLLLDAITARGSDLFSGYSPRDRESIGVAMLAIVDEWRSRCRRLAGVSTTQREQPRDGRAPTSAGSADGT